MPDGQTGAASVCATTTVLPDAPSVGQTCPLVWREFTVTLLTFTHPTYSVWLCLRARHFRTLLEQFRFTEKKSCSRKFLQPGRHRYLGDQSSASVSVATATNYPITETHLCADWNSCAMLYSIVEEGIVVMGRVSTQRDSAHDLPSSIFCQRTV